MNKLEIICVESKAFYKLLEEVLRHFKKKFLNEGTLTKEDLLAYYNGDDIRE